MKNRQKNSFFALIGLVMYAFTAQAQTSPSAGTPYITMTVTNNATVQIKMQAAADNTPVWVETATGNYTQVTVNTSWTDFTNYAATDTIIKVHGNLKGFNCSGNTTKLTGLTFSIGLTSLTELSCPDNSLTSLDVSGLTGLKTLYCQNNSLTSLDISGPTGLQYLYCNNNSLTSLDVSGLTGLKTLYCNNNSLTDLKVSGLSGLQYLHCNNNSLTDLDVSGLTGLQSLNCQYNSLTILDVSGLTNLKTLYCYDNNFSAKAIDDIYCGLPGRQSTTGGVIYPVYNNSSTNHTTVQTTNKQNAIAKNWAVKYASGNTDISTSGNYVCGSTPPLGTPYITLTVTNNATVQIKMQAAAESTTVWVENESGDYEQVTVGTEWTEFVNCAATNTIIKVHGNLKGFNCSGNTTKLTGLTFSSGLTNLEWLSCFGNSLTNLDVNNLTKLTILSCFNNFLTDLDVSRLTNLEELSCRNNSLTTLKVSGLTNLEELDCDSNSLASLDVSGLTNLTGLWCCYNPIKTLDGSELTSLQYLYCHNNSLTSLNVSGLANLEDLWCNNNSLTDLDISGLTNLRYLICNDNNFSTQAIDAIYCSLPQRIATDSAVIYPVYDQNSPDNATVMGTNTANALTKNWKVQYWDDTDIQASGSYSCDMTVDIDNIATTRLISIYPNPTKDIVTIELSQSHIGMLYITDISGKTVVAHKIEGTHASVDISTLSKGIYLLKVDSKVEKLIVK